MNGEYVQHSTNYHRLMLQSALWALAVSRQAGDSFPALTRQRLAAARWLYAHFDPLSGRAANLGHNDGAYILPLACGGFHDYRPVLQAAALAFLEKPVLPPGAWDELSLWLGIPLAEQSPTLTRLGGHTTRLGDCRSWATLRAVQYADRPAHADQLHVDLWWQGHNVALDPGTYRYSAPAPWNNALSSSLVHNTVTIDGHDQMRRAGRFLWIHWAQGQVIETGPNQVTAEHNGYAQLGVTHRRSLARLDARRWRINDAAASWPRNRCAYRAPALAAARLGLVVGGCARSPCRVRPVAWCWRWPWQKKTPPVSSAGALRRGAVRSTRPAPHPRLALAQPTVRSSLPCPSACR
jgi:hypothetical protein